MLAPLDRLDELLPRNVLNVAERDTPIPTIAERALQLRAEGSALVRGDIGQIVGVNPSDEVLYGPPTGLIELRRGVAELYTMSFGLEPALRPENVAMCTGAAEGLSILFRCFGHGQAVGLPRGHWENYRNGVDLAEGRAHLVDFFDDRGALNPSGLAAQIREHALAALVVNFPCNPTGAVLSGDETQQLARVVEDAGIIAIADDVYARLRFDGEPAQTLLRYAPGHAVSVGSASKEYLLPGARVGYVVSRNGDFIDRVVRRLIRANTASPSVLGQRLLLERMAPDLDDMRAGREPRLIASIRTAMKARRDALLAVLDHHGLAPTGRAPEGTIFLMASLPSWWGEDDVTFCERALVGGYFSAIPGSAFGLPGSFRLSFGALTERDIAALDERLTALRDALKR